MSFDDKQGFPKAIDARREELELESGVRVAYYLDEQASGRPLVLLHSINAAPSAMEMHPLFEHYRKTRPVCAPDLPGYGASYRKQRDYSSKLYCDTITEICTLMIEKYQESVDIVALSLSGEFAARVAMENPDLVHSLCLISPTGFTTKKMPAVKAGSMIDRLLHQRWFWNSAYRMLTTRPSIRYFFNKSFKGQLPDNIFEYAYTTTRHPDASNAPLSFLTGKLFDRDAVGNIYQHIQQPVLVLYDWDPNISFELLPGLAARNLNWRVVRIPETAGMPHWETTKKTTLSMDAFWRNASEQDKVA